MAKFLFFGRLADRVGRNKVELDLPPHIQTTSAVIRWLEAYLDTPNALSDPSLKIMINQEFIHQNGPVHNSDEVGFLPPVGGG
ncbi:MAG TPA: MoaD/ThiS family protein [Hellea balneolensis]|uniref:MoaD/ThiS family protein n=1 Tax=Hellea balneolensis TaxID=287478 RepID=A0A7C5R3Q3_9PROT|nr:MoaD/ThiS family protein [Hellea balneolensis]